jgi:hypothetical protein
MLRPLRHTNPWYTKTSSHLLQHVDSPLVVTCCRSSIFLSRRSQQSVSVERVHGPGVRIDCLVSDDWSASSSKPPRSNISRRHIILFGRLQRNPVSSTPIATFSSVDIARLTDRSAATSDAHTPPTSQQDIRYATTRSLPIPVCARDLRFQICVECGKKQSAAAGLFALRRRAVISPGFKVLRSRRG